ncbi:MAG: SDR family oxidoreductase [Gammaproteobacteria bacterium]|nr:SDR family oxidoreductase [Gammaproteobacteria bacterium]MBT4493083.1 SDR family oxidoreductase [Gammaproteobacteria bacterium]MBT7369217.1 SDR family oxidoreductase [Gammaproteobacteria bacterium]
MDLKGKTIVVTGGGQGLGRAMAIEIAGAGANLALIDLNEEQLSESVQLCKDAGGDAKSYIGNVAKEDEVAATFDAIEADFSGVHGLINNAGILRDGLLIKVKDGNIDKRMSLAEWQAVIDVNLTGVFLCGREAATRMIDKGIAGCIINISSISKAGNMGQTNYSAAKAGVAAMATVWAKELARYGIRAAAIAPGFIATDMVAGMKPEALEKMAAGIPLKRLGEPQEVAHTARYIFENDYLSGRVIELDAGLRI